MGNLLQELLELNKKSTTIQTAAKFTNKNLIPILVDRPNTSSPAIYSKADKKLKLIGVDDLLGNIPYRSCNTDSSIYSNQTLPWNGYNSMSNELINSNPGFILGGTLNKLTNSCWGGIGSGYINSLNTSVFSFIYSGYLNSITTSGYSNIIGGYLNTIIGTACTASSNFLGAGTENNLTGKYSFLGAGCRNIMTAGDRSVLIGGSGNKVNGGANFLGGGSSNNISSTGFGNSIPGGSTNVISGTSCYSAIVGGASNTINSFNYAIIAGNGIIADRSNTFFANNLSLKNLPTSAAGLPAGSVWNNGGVLNIV